VACVQQVERVRALDHLLVGRQRQALLDQRQRLALALVEQLEQELDVRVLEVVGGLLDLVLVEHVAVGHDAPGAARPDQVEDALHALEVHADAL